MSGPSLEYERKEAKALVRQVRAGDADALRRVHAAHALALRDRRPSELQLADAQHVIAREHGFTSWPRLVEYFEELERHRNAPRHNSSDDTPDRLEQAVRGVIRRHQRGDHIVARELAHFVPRFFARPIGEILATPITEADARLVIARERRRATWEELVERASASRSIHDRLMWEGASAPASRARTAIQAHDADTLAVILDEHPDLLAPSLVDREWRNTLVSMALSVECDAKTVDARRVTDLLASRGADLQRELNERLLGWPHDWGHEERVQWYLERGANPNWMPPNGFTVLEHAIVRWRNGACVDAIAARVRPRRALWIAAGLGDAKAVRRLIARHRTLTPEGRLNRPDLMALGVPGNIPPNHEADDLEIMWEAFQVAAWNDRFAVMDTLLDAGLPVDHAPLGWPMLLEAIGNLRRVPLVEFLLKRGADPDREWPRYSARAFAREMFKNNPQSERSKQLLAVCDAGDPEKIIAEFDAKRQSPPPPDARTLRAMQLAADDAARQGQTSVTTENMLVGLLRVANGIYASAFMGTGADMEKLRARIGARLLPDTDPLLGDDLPADAGAEAAVRMAAAEADRRRREGVHPYHLVRGILGQPDEPGARLLAEVGMREDVLLERLQTAT